MTRLAAGLAIPGALALAAAAAPFVAAMLGHDPFAPDLLARFERYLVPRTFHLASPRYFGLMNPTPLPIAIFGEALAATLNQNVAAWHHSPAATAIEAQVVRWLCRICGLPEGAFGSLTTGGTLANTTGLKIALNERVPEVREAGLAGLPQRPVFYASAEAHFSIEKSANVLGLGSRAGLRRVPVDVASRVDHCPTSARARCCVFRSLARP